jgi:hypothetical protein
MELPVEPRKTKGGWQLDNLFVYDAFYRVMGPPILRPLIFKAKGQ